ncbi:MAG: hypothetical protein XD38_0185 [Pseudomonas sp. 63_8]|jgi:hypothetical protein|nr:MAG: hypothetical protein XD38_0185 [Pseudomonas sp. 63_8]
MTPERLDGIAHFGRLRIAPWRNDMQADPVELEQLRHLEGIVGSHFERFAWQEELTLDWQPI